MRKSHTDQTTFELMRIRDALQAALDATDCIADDPMIIAVRSEAWEAIFRIEQEVMERFEAIAKPAHA